MVHFACAAGALCMAASNWQALLKPMPVQPRAHQMALGCLGNYSGLLGAPKMLWKKG